MAKQASQLERRNKGDYHDDDDDLENVAAKGTSEAMRTEEDIRLEEQEIKELEMKKRALEERVAGMEKDLGGLLR